MTEPAAPEASALSEQIRDVIRKSGVKQLWIAEQLGISQKHLSQMLTGRVTLALDWAQRIAALCGYTATVTVGPAANPEMRRQLAAVIKVLGTSEAAIARVRHLVEGAAHTTNAGISDYDIGRHDLAKEVLAILARPEDSTGDIRADNSRSTIPNHQANEGESEDNEVDTCRAVDIGGETIHVRGVGALSEASREALAEIVSAARRKFEAEHPLVEPKDPERRERYAQALYVTLEVTPRRHPWETLSPLRRAVWYARADAAIAMADVELGSAVERADRLAATLDEVLRHFVHKGHPGEPCLQTGWISEKTVARWRAVLNPPKEP
ncbi:helix-turn-helix domain-containing protein [Streptomyces sp. NBC_00444]|uniref:helix-turn-helix transcriptional regulator n=1 Tax=Streptomyces sp. NBC_00444 TaxID=2975744 RepID=UPI002E1C556F